MRGGPFRRDVHAQPWPMSSKELPTTTAKENERETGDQGSPEPTSMAARRVAPFLGWMRVYGPSLYRCQSAEPVWSRYR